MPKEPIASLIRDETLYPRIHISEANVASIKRTLEAGFEIPPVIADKKTKTLVDGWHRVVAVEAVFGPDAEIEVTFRTYRDRAAMFEEAILLQNHGERLQQLDLARCILLADEIGLERDRLAQCMRVQSEWLDSLARRKIAQGPDGLIPVKGTLAHVAKRQNDRREEGEDPPALSKKQITCNERASGASWWFILDQAINVLSNGIVPLENEKAIPRIEKLRALTTAALDKIHASV